MVILSLTNYQLSQGLHLLDLVVWERLLKTLNMPKNKKKRLNKYLVLTSASFQIGITVFLASSLGKYFDLKYNLEKNWFTILFVLLALIISMYSLIQQLNKLNNE
jgi:hypothetical protein